VRSTQDLTAPARIRDAAIDQFGRHGFGVGVRAIATAAGVSPGLVIHHFGSKDGLHEACDAYIAEAVRESKSGAIQTHDPVAWFAAYAEVESFAPMMAYLVRSMKDGGGLATSLWRRMIDNAELYLDEGVQAGTVQPSADPKARARYLALTSGGGFLLYLQLHESTDMRTILHDYAQDMTLPALEVYTNGLLTDSTMYDAFLARRAAGLPIPTSPEEATDDNS
jgi:TetR/AcrR family transcriptional regulator, regulator of cefoperazone and chloramphenicol sensitivity